MSCVWMHVIVFKHSLACLIFKEKNIWFIIPFGVGFADFQYKTCFLCWIKKDAFMFTHSEFLFYALFVVMCKHLLSKTLILDLDTNICYKKCQQTSVGMFVHLNTLPSFLVCKAHSLPCILHLTVYLCTWSAWNVL